MAFYRCWISTNVNGSEVEDVIELDDDLTPEQVEQEIKEYVFQFMDWGFKQVESDDNA